MSDKNVTAEQYAEALRTVKQYREERGLDFWFPINIHPESESITMEEFRLFLRLGEYGKL